MSKSNDFLPGRVRAVERHVHPLDLRCGEPELLRDGVGDRGLEALAGRRVVDLPLRALRRAAAVPGRVGRVVGADRELAVVDERQARPSRTRRDARQSSEAGAARGVRARSGESPATSGRRRASRRLRSPTSLAAIRLAQRHDRDARRPLTRSLVTNPDKPFFPARGLTKGDLVAYYLDVAAARCRTCAAGRST